MNHQNHQIWEILKENNIVQGLEPKIELESPWYIKALLGMLGWIASIFVIGIFSPFTYDSDFLGFSIVSILLLGCAFFLFSKSTNDFLEHLGLAISLSGQVYACISIFSFFNDFTPMAWFTIFIFQILLVMFMANFVHRVFSTLFASIALLYFFTSLGFASFTDTVALLGVSFCWIKEFSYPRLIAETRAIGYGLVLYFVALPTVVTEELSYLIDMDYMYSNNVFLFWLGRGGLALSVLYVVWWLSNSCKGSMSQRMMIMSIVTALLVCAFYFNIMAVIIGIVIICLGFYSVNRILIGLGIIITLFDIFSYYYWLDSTLLEKSISLLMLGITLLLSRWLISRLSPSHDEMSYV